MQLTAEHRLSLQEVVGLILETVMGLRFINGVNSALGFDLDFMKKKLFQQLLNSFEEK